MTREEVEEKIENRLREITAPPKGNQAYESWVRSWVRHEDSARPAIENLDARLGDGPHLRLLDLGCGVGGLVCARAGKGRFSVGLDPYEAFLDVGRIRRTWARGPAHFVCGIGEAMPFTDGSFDLITALDVLEHAEDPAAILLEIKRLLRPGGRAYLIVVSRYGWWDGHYGLPFINWLPRAWGAPLARALRPGRIEGTAGRQTLERMNYLTFHQFTRMTHQAGFSNAKDLRELRLESLDFPPALRGRLAALACRMKLGKPLYHLARFCFLRCFPVAIQKA